MWVTFHELIFLFLKSHSRSIVIVCIIITVFVFIAAIIIIAIISAIINVIIIVIVRFDGRVGFRLFFLIRFRRSEKFKFGEHIVLVRVAG